MRSWNATASVCSQSTPSLFAERIVAVIGDRSHSRVVKSMRPAAQNATASVMLVDRPLLPRTS
jgi:hypothetical protein